MPIDIATESLLAFPEGLQDYIEERSGYRPDRSTVYSWRKGVGSPPTVLEVGYLGGKPFTSKEAMQRFSERRRAEPAVPAGSPHQSRKRSRATCEAAGF